MRHRVPWELEQDCILQKHIILIKGISNHLLTYSYLCILLVISNASLLGKSQTCCGVEELGFEMLIVYIEGAWKTCSQSAFSLQLLVPRTIIESKI